MEFSQSIYIKITIFKKIFINKKNSSNQILPPSYISPFLTPSYLKQYIVLKFCMGFIVWQMCIWILALLLTSYVTLNKLANPAELHF